MIKKRIAQIYFLVLKNDQQYRKKNSKKTLDFLKKTKIVLAIYK